MENKQAKINESNKGSIIIQGNKYCLSISGIEIISDGKSTWTIMKDAGEVNISDAGSDDTVLNPAKIFTIYNQGFKNTYIGEATSNNKPVHKIELVPTTAKDFKKVILEIEKATSQITGAVMFGNDNNEYTITISSMNTAKTYPESTFTFNKSKYPKLEVIDMR